MQRPIRIAVLFPSTGLLDGEICDMARERGAEALIFRVAPGAVASARDAAGVARMTEEMGSPELLARIAATAAAVKPDVVAWACTSGSFLGSAGWRSTQAEAMSRALGGVPATTTSVAVLDALRRRGASRVAVVTPYLDSIGERFVDFLREHGFRVGPARHAGCGSDEEVGSLGLEDLLPLAREAVAGSPEALVIPCTAVRRQDLEPRLGAEFGIPVILANSATLDHAVMLGRAPS